MDATAILVIVFGVVFIFGGLIAGHYATKACQKEDEMNKTKK